MTETPRGAADAADREGVRLARDPGVALSYAASFVARADLALVASFLSLWIVDYARSVRGIVGHRGPGQERRHRRHRLHGDRGGRAAVRLASATGCSGST
ncbi:hypothetical protein, partial [Nonomuraea dietziae]|uniref:hypothetical protein n=1 Tax=Nonomuraea dietziae TaxID=65515 RepID=UPI0031DC6D74